MTCHFIFIMWHYYHHSYIYSDNSLCNKFLTHVLTCTSISLKCGNSGMAQLLFRYFCFYTQSRQEVLKLAKPHNTMSSTITYKMDIYC